MPIPPAPVLVLGAGVNGICVARELVLNGVPVWMVDTNDIAFGATAKSSRLIHGGLRYLEYGDFRLVAESLHERDRLLRLAPQFVSPLRLHIPVRRRLGGFIAAGLRFLGLSRTRLGKWIGSGGGRGLWTVRFGLWLYDLLARSKRVPRHAVHRTGAGGPSFPVEEYPWSCAYFDAQMERPERFCVALLRDMEEVAKAQGTEFRLLTYHRAVLQGSEIQIRPVSSLSPSPPFPVSRSPLGRSVSDELPVERTPRSVPPGPRGPGYGKFPLATPPGTYRMPLEASPVPLTPALSPTAESVPKVYRPWGRGSRKTFGREPLPVSHTHYCSSPLHSSSTPLERGATGRSKTSHCRHHSCSVGRRERISSRTMRDLSRHSASMRSMPRPAMGGWCF